MKIVKNLLIILFSLFFIFRSLHASKEILISLKGKYLAYSYDFNQLYGENIRFQFSSYSVSCQFIKIDIPSRTFYTYGSVLLEKEEEKLQGDEFLFNPQKNNGKLISYEEKIVVKDVGEKESEISLNERNVLDELTLSKLKKSFIYFESQTIEITNNFDVYGYDVLPYIEGIESVGIKKFRLSAGIGQRRNGISLDRAWYTKSQGLIGRVSYSYEKEEKINSLTQLNYEEHTVLKNYTGMKRQADLMSSTTIILNKNLNLGLTGNYNSSSLWNTRVWLNTKWGNRLNTMVDFSYNKPINLEGEAWLGIHPTINAGKMGNIAISTRYETHNQILANFSYTNTFFKKFNFLLSSSYSQLKIGRSKERSKLFIGNLNLSYASRIFNLSTDYYLNRDLFGNQLLSQPRLTLNLIPFNFYGGLLRANIYNVFIYNKLKMGEIHKNNYSNNTGFNLSTQPVYIQKSLSLNFSIALEEFIEKEGRNFTSGGFIVHANKNIFKGISLESIYSIQSRRKTKDWFIEGTTSQDLSVIFKADYPGRLNSWVSFSYDPKNNRWRQSFADISIDIIRNWRLHSLINYDFLLKKINNVDLYLIRDAGRFQLRFIWQSLSKQFLVELVPR